MTRQEVGRVAVSLRIPSVSLDHIEVGVEDEQSILLFPAHLFHAIINKLPF